MVGGFESLRPRQPSSLLNSCRSSLIKGAGQNRSSVNGERLCENGLQVGRIDRPVEPSVE